MEQKSSSNNIIIIVAAIILILMFCCCFSVGGIFFLTRYSTRKLIDENNSYRNLPLTTGDPTATPTENTKKFSDDEIKTFTDKIFTTFKSKGSKEVYDTLTDSEYRSFVSYNEFKSNLDQYQKYDSYKIEDVYPLTKSSYEVQGTIVVSAKTYNFSIFISIENSELKANDIFISSYKF